VSWLVGSGSTPLVLDLTPCGSDFVAEVKKIPLSVPHQSTDLRPSPSRWSLKRATVPLCKGGARVRRFSGSA
jgi:hypothetical protein